MDAGIPPDGSSELAWSERCPQRHATLAHLLDIRRTDCIICEDLIFSRESAKKALPTRYLIGISHCLLSAGRMRHLMHDILLTNHAWCCPGEPLLLPKIFFQLGIFYKEDRFLVDVI